MAEEIVNKVATSGLVNLDLSEFAPSDDIVRFDLKDLLWQELVLKEKDFRTFVKSHDWEQYNNKAVAVFCSADAIVPDWAFMLITASLTPFAKRVYQGTADQLRETLYLEHIRTIDAASFRGARVVVKGCSDEKVPTAAFVELVSVLQPVVKSLMYGEPCSTVPIYKQPKQ